MDKYDHEKTSVESLSYRVYPAFEKSNDLRFIDLKQGRATIPAQWGYYQYLILVVFTLVLGKSFLDDRANSSVIKTLLQAHIKKNTSNVAMEAYRESYSDTYLLYMADDLQLLYMHDLIPKSHIKRLRSENDGEMRGVLYELTLAAGFVRAGYKLKWLTEDSLPEFIATKDGVATYVEAKRRNRSSQDGYDVEYEFKAIQKNLYRALKKRWTGQYVIFIDTDLPPASSDKHKRILMLIADEIGKLELNNVAIIITHNGFEYTADAVNDGKTSTLIIQGDGSVTREDIKDIIHHINAPLPPSFSEEW